MPARFRKTTGRVPQRESGVVLVVTLIMLLILTILGLMASDTSTLQYRMTTHSQKREQAFETAEAAMTQARAKLLLGSLCTTFGGSGCYPENTPGTTPRWKRVDWTASGATFLFTPSPTLVRTRYFVEKMPPSPAPGQNVSRPNYGNVPPLQFFQIVAEASGDGTPEQVVLEKDLRP